MLSIKNLSKYYGETKVLHHISFQLEKGKCFGLVGPNGAGKSTLLKIIVGIIQNDEGTITFEKTTLSNPKKYMGYVPQDICLTENVSALENLYFFGKMYDLKGTALQDCAEKVLSDIGLTDRKKDKVNTFSGGMKRRLNIGCALMNEPQLIMMDEPTVGIDPQSRHYILKMIDKMKNEGRTIIYSSHYIEEVEKVCDEVAFIDQGKIVEQNTVEKLLQQYATPAIFFAGKSNDFFINEVETLGLMKQQKNGYLLTTNTPINTMESVIQMSRKNAIELDQLALVKPKLEDVFFLVTGSELRA